MKEYGFCLGLPNLYLKHCAIFEVYVWVLSPYNFLFQLYYVKFLVSFEFYITKRVIIVMQCHVFLCSSHYYY